MTADFKNRERLPGQGGTVSPAWAEACGHELSRVLGGVVGGRIGGASLRVTLDMPSAAQARKAWDENRDLLGAIKISSELAEGQPLKLAVPLPYEGVVIARRQDSDRPLAMVWGAWLGESPGFRLVRPTSQQRREEIEWRIGMPRGYFIGAPLRPLADLSPAMLKRLRDQDDRLMCENDLYPEWLRPLLGNYGPRGGAGGARKRAGMAWTEIHEAICEHYANDRSSVSDQSDQDDLNHRILVTFPVWLKGRLCDELLRAIVVGLAETDRTKTDRAELAADVLQALRTGEALDADRAAKVWAHLLEQAETVAARLVPLRRTRVSAGERVDRAEGLYYVDPTNPVDLAARMTQVVRLNSKGRGLEEMPAEFRQNHPSFQGRLCPVESPESEHVGLTLQLAQGAIVDFDGRIHPGSDKHAIGELGYGAGLIPFFQHNDGARNMMGAKNLRQALPLAGRKAPRIKTGGEQAVLDFARPLSDLGICPTIQDESGELAMGVDLLVAYLPWRGMNFEDAIVVGEQVIKSGIMDVALNKRVRRSTQVGWEPRSPFRMAVFENVTNGLAREGDVLTAGSLIATLSCGGGMQPMEIRYQDRSPAVLKRICFQRPREWMSGTLEYDLEKRIPLGIGDKLMGRHGNKGVVGAILPSDQMPKLPSDESIPKHLRGRTIDILLNPHGVISRMNIGQLLETHIGWLLHSGVCDEHDLLPNGVRSDNPMGYPFAGNVDHDKVRMFLEKSGLDGTGRVQLELPSGEKTLSPVVVGFQHIVRLRHIPELKAQARRGGLGAAYSRKTGQAVHGRVRGGGQRVGEMEVWALAGHQAEHILEEMLGGKADSDWAKKWLTQDAPPTGDLSNGFTAMLHDWLFALLVKAEVANGDLKMSFATPEEVMNKAGEGHRVDVGWGMRKLVTGHFCCHSGKKDAPCGYAPVKERIAVEPSDGKDGAIPSLRVADLLCHLGLAAEGAVVRCGKTFKLALHRTTTKAGAGTLLVAFDATGDKLKAVIRPAEGSDRPTGWPANLNEFFAEGRFGTSAKGKNIPGTILLDEMLNPSGAHRLGDLRVTCPKHKTTPLKASPPFGETVRAVPHGLFDEAVFGSSWAGTGSWSERQWGYIELPVDVKLPLDAFLTPLASWRKQSKEERQAAIGRFMKTLGMEKDDLPVVRRIPVLPVQYRMPLIMSAEPVDDVLVKRGYGALIGVCRQYENAVAREQNPDAELVSAREKGGKRKRTSDQITSLIEYYVGNLFAMLAEHLRGKAGHIRKYGLGRRVDRSARLVIVPAPSLKWDQAGVPAAVLLELLGDRVNAWLKECGKSDDLLDLVKAARAKEDDQPNLDSWSWWRSSKDEALIRAAKTRLDEYLAAHPDTLILLNRQPSLHRDSFQAFHPLALGPEAGDTIQVCPLVCKGFAADFDGDEMVIHLPVSKDAQEDAQRLLPSRNLFSLASGEVMAHFDQDFVMGSYWLGEQDGGIRQRLMDALPADCCRELVPNGRSGKKPWQALMMHLASVHPAPTCKTDGVVTPEGGGLADEQPKPETPPKYAPDAICEWMKAAFECCSRVGVSFGFYDLLDLQKTVNIGPAVLRGDPEKVNDVVQAIVANVLSQTVQGFGAQAASKTIAAQTAAWSLPGLHFAAMALSGARGLKQTRQIVGARGFLSPGAIGFEPDQGRFVISSSLADGMNRDEAFWAAMNARSSMCDKKLGTGHAGDLTRHLVFALWPFTVTCQDCGSMESDRSILTCKAASGCCAACYKALPDGALPTVGFPAGLIAAQSIGERGTQLSMQSFHTGQGTFGRAFNIGFVRRTLEGAEGFHFSDISEVPAFIERLREGDLKENKPYEKLTDRHFHVLWRVLASSPGHSLRSAIENLGTVSRMAFQSQARAIAAAALTGEPSPMVEPVARVLYGGFGKRSELISGGNDGRA